MVMNMKKNNKKIMSYDIPENIIKAFGKFYFYSFVIIVFLIFNPLFFLDKLSFYSKIGVLSILLIFYLYIIWDFFKKKSHYNSLFQAIVIIIFCCLYVFNIIKIFYSS